MGTKAIFLDRDGTINIEKQYIHRIEDFEYIPGVIEALKIIKSAGYLLIIITNQSGIARGYYTEQEYLSLNKWIMSDLAAKGVHVDGSYYCPHHPEATVKMYRKKCNCRKPALGMFHQAVKDFDIDLAQSYAVGDNLRDCAICFKSSCKGFLIDRAENGILNYKFDSNIQHCSSLLEVAHRITQ